MIRRLLKRSKYADTNLYIGDDCCLIQGIRTRGKTVASGIYDKRSTADEPIDESQYEFDFKFKRPTFGDRTTANGRYIDNRERLWKEAQPKLQDGLMKEIRIPSNDYDQMENGSKEQRTKLMRKYFKFAPIPTFPVEQGELQEEDHDLYKKLRQIANAVNMNSLTQQVEKLHFVGTKGVMEIISHMASEYSEPMCHFFQNQQDILADLENQRTANTYVTDAQYKDLRTEREPTIPCMPRISARRARRNAERECKRKHASIAFMSKEDFKEWFPSWAVTDATENIQAFFDTDEKIWRFFEVAFGAMGSLHSIYTCCRISEGLVHILRALFRILATIYIDDTAIFSRTAKIARAQHTFVQTLYSEVCGVVRTSGKTDGHYKSESIELLGINYGIDQLGRFLGLHQPRWIDIGPNSLVKAAASAQALETDKLMEDRYEIPVGEIMKTAGIGVFVGSANRFNPGYDAVKPLYLWGYPQLEKRYEKENKRREAKHVMSVLAQFPTARAFTRVALQRAAKIFKEIKPKRIELGQVDKPLMWVVTDLANSDPIMGGGVITDQEGVSRAFRFELDPDLLSDEWKAILDEVAVGEMLTLLLARKLYPAYGTHAICRTDNAYAAYAAVKGSAKQNMAMTAMVKIINEEDEKHNSLSIITYVQTHRNIADLLTRREKFAKFKEITSGLQADLIPVKVLLQLLNEVEEKIGKLYAENPLLKKHATHQAEQKIMKKRAARNNRNNKKIGGTYSGRPHFAGKKLLVRKHIRPPRR